MLRKNTKSHNSSGSKKIIKEDTSISSLSSSPDLAQCNKQWAHTLSTLYEINFTWTIDNISFQQESLQSPIFWSETNDKIKWRLILHPISEWERQDSLSIFLKLDQSMPGNPVFGKFKISILNTEQAKTYKMDFSDVKRFQLSENFRSPMFCKRSLLLNEANGFCSENKLKIFCEVSFICDNIEISSQKSIVFGHFKNPERKIDDIDFGSLLSSRKFSDITLVVGEYEFPAHKAILAGRSEVFAAMFEHDMAEVKTGRVIITDTKREVLEEMINFIYTGKTLNLKEMASDLLAVAEKYALKKLKLLCENALLANLSIETAAETLVFADLYDATQLKEKTIEFIGKHAKMIMKTKEWQHMKNANSHSSLVIETLEALLFTVTYEYSPTSPCYSYLP